MYTRTKPCGGMLHHSTVLLSRAQAIYGYSKGGLIPDLSHCRF